MKNLLIMLTVLGLFLFVEIFHSNSIKIDMQDVVCENLPASFDGLKIFFASDLHYSSLNDEKEFKTIAGYAEDFAPDIVLLGGDYGENFDDQSKAIDCFSGIQAKYGSFIVLGNHDISSSMFKAYELGEESNFKLLENSSFAIENGVDRIIIAGMDDFITGNPDIESSFADEKEGDCVILLAHEPASVLKAEEKGLLDNTRVALVGHTHGGQVTFFGLYGPFSERSLPGWTSKWVNIGKTKTFYSNGIGQKFPFRLFARREAHFITLRSKN